MPQLIAGLFVLYIVLWAIRQFGRITPAQAAKLLRGGGFAVGAAAVLLLLLRGSLGAAGALASALFAGGVSRGRNPFAPFMNAAGWGGARAPRESIARSASIEMRLDRESGRMSGGVTAGPYVGQSLDQMTRTDCLKIYRYCESDDPEGAALLEAYFDRRFPAWRQAEQGDGDAGSRSRGSAMTRDEAYEILSLPEGASRDEIVAAHRGLMKKFHPDRGGSAARAARINQAKDVLLD
jgi:hypothetical protein